MFFLPGFYDVAYPYYVQMQAEWLPLLNSLSRGIRTDGIRCSALAAQKNLPPGYTEAGRLEIHTNLESVDMGIDHFLMCNPIINATIEYNDNRISMYVVQKGVCSITKETLSLEQIHYHHKTPVSLGGDEYANLVILHERVHRLVHAIDYETISAIMQTVELKPAQLKKLNKLRKQAGNEAITFEQASKPVDN